MIITAGFYTAVKRQTNTVDYTRVQCRERESSDNKMADWMDDIDFHGELTVSNVRIADENIQKHLLFKAIRGKVHNISLHFFFMI